MKKLFLPSLILFFSIFLLNSCFLNENEQPGITKLSIDPASINAIEVLGKVLFYDKALSINNSVSCSSCHKQAFAFADNVAFSMGFENRPTSRNSMPLQNISNGFFFQMDGFEISNGDQIRIMPGTMAGALFWDGRESVLSEMVLKPIVNHKEMGINSLEQIVQKVAEKDYYQIAFKQVFGTDEITLEQIGQSLAGFLVKLTAFNTKFDLYNRGEVQLNALEYQGLVLFNEKYDCNSCHQVQSPNGYIFAGTFSNIGLEKQYSDPGLFNVTLNPADHGKFKIPSLRNVALTAPYMHDGRFSTLDDVIGHYSDGLQTNTNLDRRLLDTNGKPMVMNISEYEKRAIIAFLHTLTDFELISNPDFSNPFITVNE